MKAGFALHAEHVRAVELAVEATHWLLQRGHDVRLPEADAAVAGLADHGVEEAKFADGLDVAISLGGDGTMLRTASLVAGEGIPIIGVNLGHLGYLTEVEPAGLRMALKRFLAGSFELEERMLVHVEVEGQEESSSYALNEVVVEKTPSGSAVRISVSVNGEFFTTYAADGVIVASPTGSTAYSLSARGPVVEPTHRCLLVTAVAPHMLFDRSLVLDPDARVRLEVIGHREGAVSIDGRLVGGLAPGEAILCTGAGRSVPLVTFGPRDFLRILKTKFGLADR